MGQPSVLGFWVWGLRFKGSGFGVNPRMENQMEKMQHQMEKRKVKWKPFVPLKGSEGINTY